MIGRSPQALAVFLNTNHFAEVFSVFGCGAQQSEFRAIFDEEYLELEIGHTQQSTRNPELVARDTDLADVGKGTVLVRQSVNERYTVTDLQPDGTGMTLVKLVRKV